MSLKATAGLSPRVAFFWIKFMRVSIGGQYQGECDHDTAEEQKIKYPDTVIRGRCICCGNRQEIKTVSDRCNLCCATNWT